MDKYLDAALPIEQRIADLLGKMTVEEKVGQLNELALNVSFDVLMDRVKTGKLGALVGSFSAFAGHETEKADELAVKELATAAVNDTRLKIPLILGKDVIHGHRTVFPIPLAQAASWNPGLIGKAAGLAAREAAGDNIQWVYTPMMDICRDPRWGRIVEGFGESPYLASQIAAAAVRGYQSAGLAATAKHFVGYGAAEGGRDYNCTEISEYTLRNVYLAPFKAAVEAGVMSVMSSFNDINGEPVSGSKRLLTDILKNEYGFDGIVVGDWEVVGQLVAQGVAKDRKEAAEIAFNAGVDMDGIDECYADYLPELLREGKCSYERLDDAVGRILRVKFRLGLFERPFDFDRRPCGPSADTRKFAREFARNCVTLLQNCGDLLPLPKSSVKIAVIGPFAGERRSHLGAWTLDGAGEDVVTIVEGIKKAVSGAEIILPESGLFDDAITAVRKAEVVVAALGESHDRTGESRGAADIVLSPDQIRLLREAGRHNRNIVSVVCAGRPLELEEVCGASKSVLYAWHSGVEAGAAIADALFGNVNPSARLPVTFPRKTGQIPIYHNHRAAGRKIYGYYGDEEFKNYQDCPGSPMFPFGYGLQYTEYEYSDIKADKNVIRAGEEVTVTARVANIGKRSGTETAQCYLGRKTRSVIQPLRELAAFERVYLERGEEKTVSFTLGTKELSFYGTDGRLTLEGGEYAAWIGGDCLAEMSVGFTVTAGNE